MARPLSCPQLKFCQAYTVERNGTAAYLAAYPRSSNAAARSSAVGLLAKDNIKAEIARIRAKAEARAGSAVLTLAEKRTFLARVLRANGGTLDEKMDADLINGVKFSSKGKRMIEIPCKLRALQLDNDLAGEGSEARGMSALGAFAQRLRK